MSKSNCTSIDVDFCRIKFQLFATVHILRCKSLWTRANDYYLAILYSILLLTGRTQEQMEIYLVDFKKVNVINLEAGSFHCCRDCNSWTNTHYSWINSNCCKAPTFAHSAIMMGILREIYKLLMVP